MITLEDFLNENKKEFREFRNKTKREYTEKDLPFEIRRDIKAWIKKIELIELNEDQKKLLELIKEGAKIKIEKGKKKEVIEILRPYSPYLIIQLNNSIRRNRKWH
ncbi:MAG: hypothetical protein RXO36_05315 [Candidatus Nanopusillus acidilobi]